MIRMDGKDVKSVALHSNLFGLISNAAKFTVQIIPDPRFVAADGVDID
jgi:hypothetical protein